MTIFLNAQMSLLVNRQVLDDIQLSITIEFGVGDRSIIITGLLITVVLRLVGAYLLVLAVVVLVWE